MIKKKLEEQNKKAVQDFKKKMEDTEDKAYGGRIGFKGGADLGTVDSETRKATAKSVDISPTGNVTTSRDKGPDPVDDRSTFEQTVNQRDVFDKPKERNWKPLVGSIIKKTECKIIPIYFKGKNSLLFQIVGFLSDQLRRLLFIRELLNKKNNNYFLKVGNCIDSNKFKYWIPLDLTQSPITIHSKIPIKKNIRN